MKHIIHFTSHFSKLSSIINTSSLRLKYCQEDFSLGDKMISRAAHPMVCFCNHDIDQLQSVTITYGRYGIAFTDEWVRKNKLHPVLYFDKASVLADALAKLLKARQNKEDSKLPDNLRLPIITIKCFTKNAQGYNSALKIDNFNFAEEREWRFVPNKKDIDDALISQNRSTYLKNKAAHNRKLLPFPLRFTSNDVSRIFVATDGEAKILEEKGIEKDKISLSKWKILSERT